MTEDGENSRFPMEFLNSQTPQGMAPHCLKLKVGAIVMLLRNLNVKKGLCNGTRLIVRRMHLHIIECQKIDAAPNDPFEIIPRINLKAPKGKLPFDLIRKQFPIKVAYAMTINKSQGQTFDKIGLYLQNPVFTHGQFYVGVSRVKKPEDLVILTSNQVKKTKNIVYSEILN